MAVVILIQTWRNQGMAVVILIQTWRNQGMNGKMTMRVVLRTFRIFPKRRVVSTPWPITLRNSMVLL